MILNELSLKMRSMTKQDIKEFMTSFLGLYHELKRKKGEELFFYTDELMVEELCNNYTIYDWLKDPCVEQKEKDLFRSMIHRGKILSRKDFLHSEMLVNLDQDKYSAIGCLAAYEWDSYVVSWLSDSMWTKEYIEGEYYNIEAQESIVRVQNCSDKSHIDRIVLAQKRKSKLIISSGKELWEKREELFPNLIFCDSVKKQLEEARVSLHIQTVINRLQILEDYFSTYKGIFNKDNLGYGCRYESETVQHNEKMREQRKFKTPFGIEEYFYWHISFNGNYPGRIHFLPDPEHKKGIVGYVGIHLKTDKF